MVTRQEMDAFTKNYKALKDKENNTKKPPKPPKSPKGGNPSGSNTQIKPTSPTGGKTVSGTFGGGSSGLPLTTVYSDGTTSVSSQMGSSGGTSYTPAPLTSPSKTGSAPAGLTADQLAQYNKTLAAFSGGSSSGTTPTPNTGTNNTNSGGFNLANYVTDPTQLAKGTQIMNQAGYSTTGGSYQAPKPPKPTEPTPITYNQPTTSPITNTGLISQLVGLSNQTGTQVDKTAQEIADLRMRLARELSANASNPIPLEFQQGRGRVLSEMGSQMETALQGKLSNQMAGSQLRGGLLGSALNATQPVSVPYGTQYGSPQDIAANQGNVGQNLGTAGDISGRMTISQGLPQDKANLAVASSLAQSIQSVSGMVNPSDFTDINAITSFLYGKVADPKYQALSNAVSQFVTKIAPILGVDINTIALDIKGKGGNIMQTVNNLLQLAQANITAKQNIVSGSNTPINTIPTFSNTTSGTSNDPLGIR